MSSPLVRPASVKLIKAIIINTNKKKKTKQTRIKCIVNKKYVIKNNKNIFLKLFSPICQDSGLNVVA